MYRGPMAVILNHWLQVSLLSLYSKMYDISLTGCAEHYSHALDKVKYIYVKCSKLEEGLIWTELTLPTKDLIYSKEVKLDIFDVNVLYT